MSDRTVYASYPVFRAIPEALPETEREVAVKEIEDLLGSFKDRVDVRGTYSLAGFRADADLMFWWVANTSEDLQELLVAFRRTRLGRALDYRDQFLGLVRPAEFAADHLPAFVKGDNPKPYVCVYPYVRTNDWYLLPAEERGKYLREHGLEGRNFPDVLANTTSAFGLGDYEWILCFEADGFERIVDLLRALRAVEARRYTKVETPFYSGIRKDLGAAVADLP